MKALPDGGDPIEVIQAKARTLVFEALERGWEGPPYNPTFLARMLGARLEANSSVADARLSIQSDLPLIEYNPRQARERMRFSIAHEVAHLIFADWADAVRYRGGQDSRADEWQLEMLCNIAASEFIMPLGSLPSQETLPPIEELMRERQRLDVSAEAYLLRLTKASTAPVSVLVAAPITQSSSDVRYRVEYVAQSPSAPKLRIRGLEIPTDSIVHNCTAIGQTLHGEETWLWSDKVAVECVGVRSYSGSNMPRVLMLIRFDKRDVINEPIAYRQGSATRPNSAGNKVICQVVNDKATSWGSGFARQVAKAFPSAQDHFKEVFISQSKSSRLGKAIISPATENTWIASLVAQEGFGPSLFPRIRYASLTSALEETAKFCVKVGASAHMPRIGTGQSGGSWDASVELIEESLVGKGVEVYVYDLPPKRDNQLKLF